MPETINIYNNTGEGFTNINPFLDATSNIKTTDKVTTRKTNCYTPFRMPLFGSRKQTNCNNCEPNTKVLKDNHALYCCYDPYITSQQNKGGIIKNDFMYSNSFLLHNRNKTYAQNIVNGSTEKVDNEEHTYRTTPEDTREILIYTITNVTEDNKGKYLINGKNNPRLQLYRNKIYKFIVDAPGHPFWIKTISSTNNLNGLSEGITNNGIDYGEITVFISDPFLHKVYYNCEHHSSMAGMINIYNSNNDYIKCRQSSFKKRNQSHWTNGAVSHRSRLNRLKYNAINARKNSNYGANCPNRNNNCLDNNLAPHRVNIAKPMKCSHKTFHDKIRHRNKKLTCDPNYTGDPEDVEPNVTYIFPKFIPQRQPPPENGLLSTFYHNNYITSFSLYNFNYNHMEFNTSFNNRNPTFVPGPVQTVDTTNTSPSENFTFDISENQITYVTQTSDVTTVVTTDVKEGTTETDIYLTSSIRDELVITGEPTLSISEIKVMNKTIKVVISYTNISHWHYSIDNDQDIEVYSGYATIFNVSEYKTYTLLIKGVDSAHKSLIEKVVTFTTTEPLGISYQPINPNTNNTNTTTTTTTDTNTNTDGY
jgi:hypothetical protein|uniref:Uncharacterized protein n=1 Tax=viral metagenome TaxID=1070528 RepID=A0A6C0ALW9_9ZZZZ